MSKHRLLGGVAVAALALGGMTAIAVPAQAAPHQDATTVATTVAGHGWVTNAEGPGTGGITGALAPGGEDAAEFTLMGDGTIQNLFGTSYIGTKFADISGLTYDTYIQHSEQSILAPSIGVEIWGGSTDSFLGSLVYEPYVADAAQPVTQGEWQTWDAMDPNALWWSSRAILNPDGSVLYAAQQAEPLASIEAAFAAYPAKYSNIETKDGVKTYVGSSNIQVGWNNFVGYVDNVHVTTGGATPSDTSWDFTTGIGSCNATVDDATETVTLTDDCSTYNTLTIPDGWTLDGAGYTIFAVEDASHPSFPGPVVLSATGNGTQAATMNVFNLDIESQGFTIGGSSGGTLAGIKYDRAGGYVSHVTINGISHGDGVQEGVGLYVRNRDAGGSTSVPPATIAINNVTVTNYQKSGMVLDGNLSFTLTHSTIGSAGGPDGSPLTSLAANSLQISRTAHGTVTGNQIGLNEYNPTPPPGDGSDATAMLLYNAKTVTVSDNLITGNNGDVGIDVYNDSLGVIDTNLTASCNLFTRNESSGDYDPYGVGVATYNDGSTAVDVSLSDSTFTGWNKATSLISYDGAGNRIFGDGVEDQALGACPPTQPGSVSVSGGDGQSDVTWAASSAPFYAPLDGYTVLVTDLNGVPVTSQQVDADATSAHVNGLTNGTDYIVSVVATSGGGSSTAGVATLHSTTLALSSLKGQVVYGKKTSLTGTLTSTDGDATLAGRTVTIESSPAGSGTWSTLGTRSVSATGAFTEQVTMTANTDYRAVYAGDPDLASTSPTVTVNATVGLKVRVSSKHVHTGAKVLFSGVVKPANPGGLVELQQKQLNGTWQTLQTHALDAQSSFGFHWKATSTGIQTFRIEAHGDDTHLDGYSKAIRVTVN